MYPVVSLKPGTRAYNLAFRDQEVLIKYCVPQSAIVGVIFTN